MNNIKNRIIIVVICALLLSCLSLQTGFALPSQKLIETGSSKDNLILVKFKNDRVSELTKDDVKKSLKLNKLSLKKKMKLSKLEILEIDETIDSNQVITEFKSNPNVEYAQANFELLLDSVPTDPSFNQQWGLYNSGQSISGSSGSKGVDINILPAWNITYGSGSVVIGVLDSGIDISHIDLANNIYLNNMDISNNGVDEDNNGFIDDTNGWDFSNNDSSVYDSSINDAHGTHVAGIISASANNEGICGVAPNIKILPLKFVNGNSGYTSDAIEAIEYANQMGVKIINCSWSSPTYNLALKDTMSFSDILFICSAGNNGNSTAVYPASFGLSNILSVAAIDNKGTLATFSNFGTSIDVAAPGVNIFSTMPNNTYAFQSGTSMAGPFVTGIAALIKSQNPSILAKDITLKIKNNVTTSKILRGKVATSGRVNAYMSLTH